MATEQEDASRANTVVAAFNDLGAARAAIVALERSRIDAGAIRLLGAEDQAPATGSDARKRDVRVTGAVGRNASRGAIVGAVIGAVIAIVLTFLLSSDIDAGGLAGPLLGGVLLGGALGGLFGVFLKLPADAEDWERTFDDESPGQVYVSVRSVDATLSGSAAKLLTDLRPVSVRRYDPAGKEMTV